ncbi:arginine--tRNA ligase [Geochorda subterranea]|uniref:Arginine--tRNA ligase n=1 Tax=Geochorda subterranea TaxID=3109564 RepID=A0ABZ1BRH1_9FIRM|nr:arginine--tRNA ligase [Limnochorda sp. LNt]WRP15110.1 arginine--tRNA ligase [Limnochorda sp. LNt]
MRSALDVKRALGDAVVASLQALSREQGLGPLPAEWEDRARAIEVPKDPAFGDFASGAAMATAGHFHMPPRRIAEALAERLRSLAGAGGGAAPLPPSLQLTSVEVAGPGFVNMRLDGRWLLEVASSLLRDGPRSGVPDIGQGRRVQIEFVSANPTGPMNVVNARAAAVGDAMARLLEAVGFRVTREYYVNDAGRQARLFAESVAARMAEILGEPHLFPEDGYPGEYVREIAEELLREEPTLARVAPAERLERLRDAAVDRMLGRQRGDLEAFGVHFDVWFRERALHEQGRVQQVLQELERRGFLYEAEGARWLRSTAFGDDKDRVVVKSDGALTYLASDIAYHDDKFRRGFDLVIDIWGPDHHGYVARMKAAMQALGYAPERLEIVILQLVSLVRGGEAVRMSKRAGEFVTLAELLDEVGADAARYFFLQRSPESPVEVDLDLATLQSMDNPVYYVQYAHARICSVFRQAEAEGVEPLGEVTAQQLAPLQSPHEQAVLKALAAYAEEVRDAALRREPQRIVQYVYQLASAFHSFYHEYRLLDPDPSTRRARLALAEATRRVLADALGLLGISAPDRM